jgi:hypothetical protein
MIKPLSFTIVFGIVAVMLGAAPGKQTFTGVVTDSMCSLGDHSSMGMGPTNAECTTACVREHGAEYVIYDGKNVYTLSDQTTPEKFAGQKVKVVGTLDPKTKTIKVELIAPAK